MTWSTNGAFIYPTDDAALLARQRPALSVEVREPVAAYMGLTRAELCEHMVWALNAMQHGKAPPDVQLVLPPDSLGG